MLTARLYSTGSAGLIQTIQMYVKGHIAAAIVGTVASVGWVLQGVGNALYYRQVRWHHSQDPRYPIDTAASDLGAS